MIEWGFGWGDMALSKKPKRKKTGRGGLSREARSRGRNGPETFYGLAAGSEGLVNSEETLLSLENVRVKES